MTQKKILIDFCLKCDCGDKAAHYRDTVPTMHWWRFRTFPGEGNRDVNVQTWTQPVNHKQSRGGSQRWYTVQPALMLLSPLLRVLKLRPWQCPGLLGQLCCLSIILFTLDSPGHAPPAELKDFLLALHNFSLFSVFSFSSKHMDSRVSVYVESKIFQDENLIISTFICKHHTGLFEISQTAVCLFCSFYLTPILRLTRTWEDKSLESEE